MPFLILVSLIWGFSFVIIKGSLTSLDSSFVAFARLLLSLIVFLPFLRPARIPFSGKLQLMMIGGVQYGVMYLAYIAAFRDLPAHGVALLTTTTPILFQSSRACTREKPGEAHYGLLCWRSRAVPFSSFRISRLRRACAAPCWSRFRTRLLHLARLPMAGGWHPGPV